MRRAIYEDDVIKLLDKGWKTGVYPVASNIQALPTVQPQTGKWEITDLGAVGVFDSCSRCKKVVKHKAPFYNFCPHCGADMRTVERREE